MDNQFIENQKWTCTYCDTSNNSTLQNCDSCEAARPKPTTNVAYDRQRTNSVKTQSVALKPEVVKSWECVQCTVSNTYDVDRCYICDHHAPHYNKWRCDHCTMLNEQSDVNCTVCLNTNHDLKLCPECHSEWINIKLATKCAKCINKAKDIRHDDWSCSKCSMRNSYDRDKCSVCNTYGHGDAEWRCDHCTFVNTSWVDNCRACEQIRPSRSTAHQPVLVAVIAVDVHDNDAIGRQLEHQEFITVNVRTKKIFCVQCEKVLSNDEDTLCYNCKKEYFVCGNAWCRSVVGPNIAQCTKCDNNNDDNRNRNIGGWRCTWRQCQHFNDNDNQLCDKCCCFAEVGINKMECNTCGWIKSIDLQCSKCGS